MNTPRSTRNYTIQAILLLTFICIGLMLYLNWYALISQIVESQKHFHGLLAQHVKGISEDPVGHGLTLVGLSFTYGVFHAIGPGHGKAVIVAYLGSHKESLKRGALISLLAALFQALVAILLVVVLAKLLSIKFSAVNAYADDITTVSYLLVMALGGFLFMTASIRQFKRMRLKQAAAKHAHPHTHSHPHQHNHDEDTCCGGHHVHQSAPQESWSRSIGVIISMGMRPCAGAIVVLIYAHLVGAFEYGVLATFMMGLGTGLSIAGIALGTQLAKNWFVNLAKSGLFQSSIHTGNWLRMAGGVIIFLLGFSLFHAATQTMSSHPLL